MAAGTRISMAKETATWFFTGVLSSAVGVLHIFNSFSTYDHVNIREQDSYPLSTTFYHFGPHPTPKWLHVNSFFTGCGLEQVELLNNRCNRSEKSATYRA